jgi:ABC-type nitrate/sulfonate/bicarbonate transport system substrate-binding protein
MKKLHALILAIFSIVAVTCVEAQEKIRIGLGSISLQSGLVHIAKDRGLFAKYGLTVESIYIPGGSTNVQVLVSGNLDLSQLSDAPGVAANLEGADIVYFAGLLDKLNYQLIARSDIKSIEQLKGRKIRRQPLRFVRRLRHARNAQARRHRPGQRSDDSFKSVMSRRGLQRSLQEVSTARW